MSSSFANLPKNARSAPTPFKVSISEEQLQEFQQLLHLSKIGPKTFESEQADGRFGITRDWLLNAKATWEKWDW
jgi:microsomal epoxide hydrolase